MTWAICQGGGAPLNLPTILPSNPPSDPTPPAGGTARLSKAQPPLNATKHPHMLLGVGPWLGGRSGGMLGVWEWGGNGGWGENREVGGGRTSERSICIVTASYPAVAKPTQSHVGVELSEHVTTNNF